MDQIDVLIERLRWRLANIEFEQEWLEHTVGFTARWDRLMAQREGLGFAWDELLAAKWGEKFGSRA